MTRPLSNDLRERVVAAVLSGASCHKAAARFDVAVSSVVKLMQRYRATGSVAPGKMGGHRKRVLLPYRDFIQERLKETPHLSLHALKAELAARGVAVSHNAVWEFLRREGLRFQTSIPSNRPSPKSSTGCGAPKSAPSKTSAPISAPSLQPSQPPNAKTTSKMTATVQLKGETL